MRIMNRLAAIIATLCLASGAVAQTEIKQDIRGFTPGITEEQLLQLLKDQEAKCPTSKHVINVDMKVCVIDGKPVTFVFSRGTLKWTASLGPLRSVP